MQHALIVDDEPDIRELLEITLNRMKLDTSAAANLSEARALLEKQTFDVCLTDMRLPDGNGIELIEYIQQHHPSLPVAMITAHGNMDSAVQSLKAGAFDFVSKPIDLPILRGLIDSALKLSNSEPATLEKKQSGGETRDNGKLLGESPAMRQLKATITKLSRSQAPVYLHGDSGTGKELVARQIHAQGPRSHMPFVPVNCGAIPAELMESEFFGHIKGSFTGATANKEGLFQAAQGGSLFLDEVAELPLHMQVKLLRAIQERAIKPVGAHQEIPVDVRILSATHKDLAEQIRQGNFREDLYYRINVIELRVPPLRERMPDMPILADHFLKRLCEQWQLDSLELSSEAMQTLAGYSFPGNIRELENILERAATLCDGAVIEPHDLNLPQTIAPEVSESSAYLDQGQLEDYLVSKEKKAIIEALEKTRWNKTAAAKLLGLSFRQLRYRLKKLELE